MSDDTKTKVPYTAIEPAGLDDINLLDHALQNCPYHAYTVLRDEAPVWRDPKTGFYVITRFEDLRAALLDTKRFSSDMRSTGTSRDALDQERSIRIYELFKEKGWVPSATLAGRNDPNHKQMRAMFNEAFRPKKIEAMDPFVRDTAYDLIDAFIDDDRCDWVKQFAIPLPLIIIARQMGAPAEDIWRIKAWTDAFANRIGLMQPESEEIHSVELEIEAQHYFQPVFERLRKEPDDSLLSELVNRVIPEWGRPLTDNELHAEMMGDTFVGGSETTTNAISYGMKLLIEQPAVWDKLKSDPERYLRTFCEEVVRLESPVQSLFRAATEDIDIGGVTIPKGAIVNMRFAVANRDGREFENPEALDLERAKPGRHLGFGSGTHHCLGAPLARREMYWAFRALIDRIDDMRFIPGANDFQVVPNVLLRAMRELHIEFDALPVEARRSPAEVSESSGASERGDET